MAFKDVDILQENNYNRPSGQRCCYNRNLYACNEQGFQWPKKSFVGTGK